MRKIRLSKAFLMLFGAAMIILAIQRPQPVAAAMYNASYFTNIARGTEFDGNTTVYNDSLHSTMKVYMIYNGTTYLFSTFLYDCSKLSFVEYFIPGLPQTFKYRFDHYDVGIGDNIPCIFFYIDPVPESITTSPIQSQPLCEHNYEWTTLYEPTRDQDGKKALRCTKCGDTSQIQSIPAYGYVVQDNIDVIKAAKSGQTIRIDNKQWNSLPKAFFEELANKRDITVIYRFVYKNKVYEMTIARDQEVDTSLDWYGPEKLIELYGAKEVEYK